MLIDEIPIGVNIEIEVKYSGRTMSFRSEVKSIINHSVLINPIKVDSQTVGFSEQCTMNLLINHDGKVIAWENIQIRLVRYDGDIFHLLELTGNGKSYNRRIAYRMYIGEDTNIYMNSSNGLVSYSILLKDISETGVAFLTKEEFDINRTFRMKLKEQYLFVNLSGVIVRKEYLPHLSSFLYGCKFIEKDFKLNKYIAYKQGEQLRKQNGLNNSSTSASSSENKERRYRRS